MNPSTLPPLMELDQVYTETPPPLVAAPSNGHQLPKEFLYWKKTNVTPQKQPGYMLVHVTVPQGDIKVEQFPALADIVRDFTGGSARTTLEQNLALRWIPEGRLFDLYKALDAIGLSEPDAHNITNVVSCPGTDSCKLGITSSMGLGRAVREELLSNPSAPTRDPAVKEMHVKISGCPQRLRPASRRQHRIPRRRHEGSLRHADSRPTNSSSAATTAAVPRRKPPMARASRGQESPPRRCPNSSA